MTVNKAYFKASFVSFAIHGVIILYLLGFFYYESQKRSVLSKPINVNLIFEQVAEKKNDIIKAKETNTELLLEKEVQLETKFIEESISFDSIIDSVSIEDLIKEDSQILFESEQSQIDKYSSLIIQTIQSAWRKPMNIQDGLVCNLRLSINKNGRVINANLIKSSGNIRFDNSALKAVQRVETFSFFNKIPSNIYSSNFKNIVITFNPS